MGSRQVKAIWSKIFIPICILSFVLFALEFLNYNSHIARKDEIPKFSHERMLTEMKENPSYNQRVILSLTHQISDLEKMLKIKKDQLKIAEYINVNPHNVSVVDIQYMPDADDLLHFVQDSISNSILLQPHAYRNEYDVIPYTYFNNHAVYQLDSGLRRHPESSWGRSHDNVDMGDELKYIVKEGAAILNKSPVDAKYFDEHDFVEGLYRTEHHRGRHYELVYRQTNNGETVFRRVTLFRAFSPARPISVTTLDNTEKIHIILPLSGRLDTLKTYLQNFADERIHQSNVHLTIVYFGNEHRGEVYEMMEIFENANEFSSYNIIDPEVEQFSRGLALHRGIMSISAENPLVFFCDVDITFSHDFLTKVRSFTVPDKKVFYPIVFSLYNPSIVYEGKPIPTIKHRQVYKKTNGFWRDFGFGMACMYKKDYLAIGGFDESIKGWGMEDVLLYRNFARSSHYEVVRTPVNGLFHHWHPKNCDKSLSKEQYGACLRTKSITEGSHTQIGMLYFMNQDN